MAKPVIVSVDDDVAVLPAIEQDLRDRYGDEFDVLTAASGQEGLQILEELRRRGTQVALLLVDQRMPGMEGTAMLEASLAIAPDAGRVLLTAYADTQAAIDAINRVGLDHYLMKPWDPPEERLYPVLDDVLASWRAKAPPPYDGIRVAGTTWSPTTHEVKDFLARSLIPYRFLDVERDHQAAALVAATQATELPVVFFPDGTTLTSPDRRALAERVGLRTAPSEDFYDLIVLGAGPAGLACGVYGASEGLRTAIVEREAVGGQAGTSNRIENYLGFPSGISGSDLAHRAATQAQRLGAELLTATAADRIEVEGQAKRVRLSSGVAPGCHAVVVATGMTVRKLSIPGTERFEGAGVFYGTAASEATTYQDRDVLVVGGGNSAGQAAMMLSRHCRTVTIAVRESSLSTAMSRYLIDQIADTPNIEVLLGFHLVEASGGDRLEHVTLRSSADGEVTEREAAAIFVFIGLVPNSGPVAPLVECDEHGFILTGPDLTTAGTPPLGWALDRPPYLMETSVPGIFAAGDVRSGVIRRVASAVGQGSVVVSMVLEYLKTV